MASYDYRCRECDSIFTEQRSMSAVATLVRCPQGHDDVHRVWSAVAVTGTPKTGTPQAAAGGGCCGGGCGCG